VNYTAPPNTFWILLFIGFFIAAFLTYNEMRRKFNALKDDFFFEPISSLTLRTGSVQLTVMFKAEPDRIVDKLWLDINGIPFTPSDWKPFKVSNQYTGHWMFDLADKVEKNATHTGKLIAKSNKKEYESREFDVYT